MTSFIGAKDSVSKFEKILTLVPKQMKCYYSLNNYSKKALDMTIK